MSTVGDGWATALRAVNRESASASPVIGVPDSELMGMTTSFRKLSLQAGLRRDDDLARASSSAAGGSDSALGPSSSREEPHPHQLCSICLGRLDDGEAATEQEKRDDFVDVHTDASQGDEAVAPESATEGDGPQLLQVRGDNQFIHVYPGPRLHDYPGTPTGADAGAVACT